ncbi:MAG: hypothetical protein ACHQHO_01380 [Solirubrobacterales bacterium]
MPDFEAHDDPLRLNESNKDEPFNVPKLRPRFTARTRRLACQQCFSARGHVAARLRPRLDTGRWRAARRACPSARTVGLPATMPSRRRRLWTTCHGRVSGSPS